LPLTRADGSASTVCPDDTLAGTPTGRKGSTPIPLSRESLPEGAKPEAGRGEAVPLRGDTSREWPGEIGLTPVPPERRPTPNAFSITGGLLSGPFGSMRQAAGSTGGTRRSGKCPCCLLCRCRCRSISGVSSSSSSSESAACACSVVVFGGEIGPRVGERPPRRLPVPNSNRALRPLRWEDVMESSAAPDEVRRARSGKSSRAVASGTDGSAGRDAFLPPCLARWEGGASMFRSLSSAPAASPDGLVGRVAFETRPAATAPGATVSASAAGERRPGATGSDCRRGSERAVGSDGTTSAQRPRNAEAATGRCPSEDLEEDECDSPTSAGRTGSRARPPSERPRLEPPSRPPSRRRWSRAASFSSQLRSRAP